jgi:diglucosylglycerate octanoyltransferase
MEPLRLVVLGDSTAFTDDVGPQLPTHKTLYPNVVASMIEAALERPVEVNVIARAGTDVRETWRTLTKDRHVQFEVMMGADAVVVGIGSIDHAPAGWPAALEEIVPYVRPDAVRRSLRRALYGAHPRLVRLTGARFSHTPLREFTRLYDRVLFQVRALARGAAGVVLGPTSHNARFYGFKHPGHRAREELQADVAASHGFSFVSSWELVGPNIGRLNPDGVHWPADAHAAVGEAVASHLVAQLRGEEARPSPPPF